MSDPLQESLDGFIEVSRDGRDTKINVHLDRVLGVVLDDFCSFLDRKGIQISDELTHEYAKALPSRLKGSPATPS